MKFVREFRWRVPRSFLLAATVMVALASLHAQDIEHVIVETYYISDANDAVQTDGGTLAEGSTTYRVFLDLCDSCTLRAIYGEAGHPLIISSTADFFNNEDRGKTFGHQVNNSALDDNSVGLDSWLSFRAASNARFGVLKTEDPDGNNIAGPSNNDGFLANQATEIGVPLTTADGLMQDTTSAIPPGFFVTGIPIDSLDSVFLDVTRRSAFISDSTRIFCSTPGVKGVTAQNKLLIAQLTTTGALSFQLNVEVQRSDGSVTRYVALDTLLSADETPNGLLAYPPMCGCTDPDFLEFDPAAGCDDGSCATTIVFGCTDVNACNYNAFANFNIPELCCFGPDSCNGLDAQLICPGVGIDEHMNERGIAVFPNPVRDVLTVRFNDARAHDAVLILNDPAGKPVMMRTLATSMTGNDLALDLSHLSAGIYLLRYICDAEQRTITVIRDR